MHDYLTVTEAADIAKLSRARLRQLIVAGKLRGEKISTRMWIVRREDFEAWLALDRRPGRPRQQQPTQEEP